MRDEEALDVLVSKWKYLTSVKHLLVAAVALCIYYMWMHWVFLRWFNGGCHRISKTTNRIEAGVYVILWI